MPSSFPTGQPVKLIRLLKDKTPACGDWKDKKTCSAKEAQSWAQEGMLLGYQSDSIITTHGHIGLIDIDTDSAEHSTEAMRILKHKLGEPIAEIPSITQQHHFHWYYVFPRTTGVIKLHWDKGNKHWCELRCSTDHYNAIHDFDYFCEEVLTATDHPAVEGLDDLIASYPPPAPKYEDQWQEGERGTKLFKAVCDAERAADEQAIAKAIAKARSANPPYPEHLIVSTVKNARKAVRADLETKREKKKKVKFREADKEAKTSMTIGTNQEVGNAPPPLLPDTPWLREGQCFTLTAPEKTGKTTFACILGAKYMEAGGGVLWLAERVTQTLIKLKAVMGQDKAWAVVPRSLGQGIGNLMEAVDWLKEQTQGRKILVIIDPISDVVIDERDEDSPRHVKPVLTALRDELEARQCTSLWIHHPPVSSADKQKNPKYIPKRRAAGSRHYQTVPHAYGYLHNTRHNHTIHLYAKGDYPEVEEGNYRLAYALLDRDSNNSGQYRDWHLDYDGYEEEFSDDYKEANEDPRGRKAKITDEIVYNYIKAHRGCTKTEAFSAIKQEVGGGDYRTFAAVLTSLEAQALIVIDWVHGFNRLFVADSKNTP